jgi:hypothetical protein
MMTWERETNNKHVSEADKMAPDHFETQIQPEEYSGDPRDSLSVADMVEVNEWPTFDAASHGLIDLSAPLVLTVDNSEPKMGKVNMEEIDRMVSMYSKSTASKLMRFGEWGGDTHNRSLTRAMLWQEWY